MSKFYCDSCDFRCRKKYYYENHINNCNYSIKKKHNKLLKLEKDMVIKIGQGNNNIAHDFHELIFHIVFHLTKISPDLLRSSKPTFIVNDKMMNWSKYLIKLICDHFNIKIKYTRHYVQRFPISIGYKKLEYRYLRDIKKYKNYLDCVKFINKLAFEKIKQPSDDMCKDTMSDCANKKKTWKVLYTRGDCKGRRLSNYESIALLFDEVIENMNIDVEEQIKIYQRATHFVTVGGANLTNIIFMNSSAKVLDIFISEIKSWCPRYGLNNWIIKYQNIKALSVKINDQIVDVQYNSKESNNDIIVDERLTIIIKKFLER